MRKKLFFKKAEEFILLLFSFLITPYFSHSQNYFQQQVNTTIHVTLDDRNHFLTGVEKIDYTNNSSDTLTRLYFHLWPNAYRDNQTALAKQLSKSGSGTFVRSKTSDRGYIDSLNFSVDGKQAYYELLTDTPDVCLLTLPSPLYPGKSIEIITPFRIKIPDADISRLGHSEQAYYITQWYPKPAVYDQTGWNYFPYLDKGEFYSEFGEFNVYITLPSNYVVAATGECLDSIEVKWLERRAKESMDTISSASKLSFPASSSQFKTIHYRADQVHDFAWFADKRFQVEKGEAILSSGKKINTWAFYTGNQPDYWKRAVSLLNETLIKFSDWFGEYPYQHATAVDGLNAAGTDMEYPMITLLGSKASFREFENTLAHEVSHFWFYGILGSNERKVGWMDEGLASYAKAMHADNKQDATGSAHQSFVNRYGFIEEFYKTNKLSLSQAQDFVYRSGASINNDQPSNLDANRYQRLNYVADIYYKPSLGFAYLRDFLGDSLYRQCMHDYFDQWKFRHPHPATMEAAFEQTSGQNLDWFFHDIIQTTEKADYKITQVIEEDAGLFSLYLKNKGKINSPVLIAGFKDKMPVTNEWVPGFEKNSSVHLACNGCDEFKIDPDQKYLEVNRQNNSIRTDGMFKKIETIRFRLLGDSEPAGRTTIFYSPVAGINSTDLLMTGIAVYNLSLIEKPFEYLLMPMYSWGSRSLVGGGRIMVNTYPQRNLISRISYGTGISHYSYDEGFVNETSKNVSLTFTKVSVDVTADFKQNDPSRSIREYLTIRNIITLTDRLNYTPCNTCDAENSITTTDQRYFVFLNYAKENLKNFHPSRVNVSTGLNKNFYRLSFEYNKTLSYAKRGKGFDFRFFAGKVGKAFHNPDDVYLDYRLHMSGIKGEDDYLYDGTFYERVYIDIPQFISGEGGFKSPTNIGQSDWLLGVNLKTIIHPVLPIKFYACFGTYEDAGSAFDGSQALMYELGLELYAIPDAIAIYFPLAYSKDIKAEFKTNSYTFGDLIRFEFNLNKLNPFYTLKQKTRYGNF